MKLRNGIEIPDIGYGTWKTPNDEVAISSVQCAIECGYRHIDGAHIYKNEEMIGKAIHNCGIDRKDLFITNKVWNLYRGYESTLKALDDSLEAMGLDYFDLYLIHWPANELGCENPRQVNRDTWQALIDAYKQGKVKAIGVSNFKIHHLEQIMDMEIQPMVNQIKFHPGLTQDELVQYCQEHDIVVEAYSPLGRTTILENEELKNLALKYHKTTSQISLRYILQKGIIPLPKSVTPSRIQENFDIFDFSISKEDMDIIDNLKIDYVLQDSDTMRP